VIGGAARSWEIHRYVLEPTIAVPLDLPPAFQRMHASKSPILGVEEGL
jgi:hypothetical protein